ncbi:hypothetical protein RJT34_03425 [Clitoria ternatea]|uniref:WIBG Mago-binding domain-containing protein n=1 Tax=Clitoria ternatea TaxID=43366 RepID=A0AAN9KK78_CLITE
MEDEEEKQMKEIMKKLKEGQRILKLPRRPDGTLRKPIRIRAGYVPQDEVPIYQCRGKILRQMQIQRQRQMQMQKQIQMQMQMQMRRQMQMQMQMASRSQVVAGPPCYSPSLHTTKPKTNSVERNPLQGAEEKEKNVSEDSTQQDTVPVDNSESVSSISSRISDIALTSDSVQDFAPIDPTRKDINKRIRALRKKIRHTEALQQKTAERDLNPDQLEKLAKLEDFRRELKLVEDEKAKQQNNKESN